MDFNFDTGSISSILELDPGTSALKISGTNGVVIPNGTTAERNAQTGIFRFNTDLGFFEGFDGVKWSSVQIDTGVSWNSGLYADIPAAGNQGAMYYATDTNTIYYDNGVSWQLESPAFSGDVTSTPGSTTLTLATVNSNTGTFGSSTAVPVLTVNEKGLITAITTDTISSAISLIGDASGSGTTGSDITLTLATVNANTGTFGSSSQVGSFTVNAKGLITAAENIAVTPEAIGAINTNQLGANNGVATLDSNGKLTSTQVPDVLVGALQYQGVWNATTNSPTLVSGTGTKGQYYKVSVAGTTTIDGQSVWQVGDLIVFNGTTWDGIDGTPSEVLSVFGRVGEVTATLASSDFANQGTTTTFLKGNDAGNPTWSKVNLSTDVEGTLQAGQFPALSGDLSTTAGSLTTTLATVNSNVGSFGSSTEIPVLTVNAKGLITAVSTASISSAISLIGDATGSGTTGSDITLTLATVNSNVGTFADSNHVAQIAVNAKGLVTSVTEVEVTASSVGAVANGGNVPSISSGVVASIPTAGTDGRIYISTDTNTIFRDNGTSWDQIGEASLLYTENAVSPVDSTVSGNNAVSLGSGNTASGTYSLVTGSGAKAAQYGAEIRANGSFSAIGDAQTGKYVLRNITADGVETEVFLDGTSAQIVLPSNSAFMYTAYVVARRTDVTGSEGAWKIEGLISRDSTASSTTLVGSRSRTVLTRPNTNWNAEVYADNTAGALTFKVTGQADNTIRWVVTVITSEVVG